MRRFFFSVIASLLAVCFGAPTLQAQQVCSFTQPVDENIVCGTLLAFNMSLAWTTTTGYSEKYEYRRQGDPAWTSLANFTAPPPPGTSPFNGTAYTWSLLGTVTEGRYFIRATLSTANGTVSDTRTVWMKRSPPALLWTVPANSAVVRGIVAFRGTLSDGAGTPTVSLAYQAPGGGSFVAIAPGASQPGEFGRWNTASLPDGTYTLRLIASDTCGTNTTTVTRTVEVDNTPPTLAYTAPSRSSTQIVAIPRGSASDAHMALWTHQLNNSPFIASAGTTNVTNVSMISIGGVPGFPTANQFMVLRGYDTAQDMNGQPNTAEEILPLDLRCAGDHNRDGFITVQDIFDFLADWFAACH